MMRLLMALASLLGVAACTYADEVLDHYLQPLPKGAKARLGMRIDRGNSQTYCPTVASPDGRLLATAVGTRVLVWDYSSGNVLQNFVAHPHQIRNLVFTDNDSLFTHGHEGNKDAIKVWNPRTGKMIRTFNAQENWAGTSFSHDGKLLALTTPGDPNNLHVWDTLTGKELYSDKEHYPNLFFSTDDRVLLACRQIRLALGKYDTLVTLREARSGKVIRKLELKDQQTVITALAPDGKFLLGHTFIPHAVQDKWRSRLNLFDAETGAVVRTFLEQRTGDLKSALFSPDGKQVAFVNHNERGISVWETATGKKLWTFANGRNFFNYLGFARDGKTLVNTTSAGHVFIHDLQTGATRDLNATPSGAVTSLAFTPDGKHLAASAYLSEIFLWDVAKRSITKRFDVANLKKPADENAYDYATKLAFAPDGKHLLFEQVGHSVRLFAPFKGRELSAFRDAGHVWGFTDDGKHLLWAGVQRHLLNTFRQTPREVPSGDLDFWLGSARWVAYTTLHPELRQFQCRAYVTPPRPVDEPARSPIMQVFGPASGFMYAPHGLSPDGSILATWNMRLAGNPSTGMGTYWVRDGLTLWDSATRQEIIRTKANEIGDAATVEFAPDSRSVAGRCAGAKGALCVALYETRTGKRRLTIDSPPAEHGSLAFSHDGRWLAFLNANRDVEIADLTLGKSVATLRQGDHGAIQMAFSPDGSLLASAGGTGTILLWDLHANLKREFNEPAWTDDDKTRLWNNLASSEAAVGFEAMMRLKRSPAPAVALLRERLQWRDANRDIGKLISQLSSADFKTRKQASDALEQLGERARPVLLKAKESSTSLEHKRRVEALLDALGKPFTTPVGLRMLRSVEVLDGLRTAEAAALLREIAAEAAPDHALAREIARALARAAN